MGSKSEWLMEGGGGEHLPALNVIRVRINQPMPCKMPFDF